MTGDMELFDLRVTVDRIEGRSVCGMAVGDYFELVNSAELRLPEGKHFCIYALQAILPLLPAKQRQLPAADREISTERTPPAGHLSPFGPAASDRVVERRDREAGRHP